MRLLEVLKVQTKQIYDENAIAFDQQRRKDIFEQKWLDRFHLKRNKKIGQTITVLHSLLLTKIEFLL